MKVLVVCSGNVPQGEAFVLENHRPFVYEQSESLKKHGIEIDYFFIQGKGLKGYLRNIFRLRKKVTCTKYDIVHAHYGLSGLLVVFQRRCPVVISFIGELYFGMPRFLSKIAMRFSTYSIFVSEKLRMIAKIRKNCVVLPYGVDLDIFFPVERDKAREALKIPKEKKIALFSSSKDRLEKNYPLAKQAVDLSGNVEIIELKKGYTREKVNLLINVCDFLLLTSFFEGSPQIIKEAMACNCPIISTDVGDVKEIIGKTEGCYIAITDPKDISDKIQLVLERNQRTKGREKVKHLAIDSIADKIIGIYTHVLKKD